MLKKHWPKTAKVYWCPNCNIPLVSSKCYKCGGEGIEVKLREPADARIAFPRDIEIAKEAFKEKFGTERGFERIANSSKIILLNKTTHIDDAKEMVINGNNAGILLFNPFTLKWEFRPSYYSALKILEGNEVETVAVKSNIKENEILPFRKQSINESQYVIITNLNGEPLGLGAVLRNGKIRVIKKYRQKFIYETSEKPATINEVIEGNIDKLERQVEEAKAFLRKMDSKIRKPIVVSFSGGKDSLVSLHLALNSVGEITLLFNNTGIELPETLETVLKVSEEYGLKLEIADAENAFWKTVNTFGPPARDYRWCCKVAKLVPLAKKMLKKWPFGALNVVGQRAYESLERAKSTRIWRNKWVPMVISVSPIQYWSQLSIWLYIFKEKLTKHVNPLYFKGFDRIGCFMCPASRLAEFEEVKKTHLNLWNKWESFLYKWAQRINAPKEWVTLGLWRWLGPAAPKKVLSRKTQFNAYDWISTYEKWVEAKIYSFEKEGKEDSIIAKVKLSKKIDLDKVLRILAILGKAIKKHADEVIVYSDETRTHYIFKGNGEILVKAQVNERWIEEFLDAVKLVYRAHYCVECGSCEALCPSGAIKVINAKPVVQELLCLKCRACNDVCPIADVMVEKLVSAMIFNRYDAWRRKTKRSREYTAKLLAELMFKTKLFSKHLAFPESSCSNK